MRSLGKAVDRWLSEEVADAAADADGPRPLLRVGPLEGVALRAVGS